MRWPVSSDTIVPKSRVWRPPEDTQGLPVSTHPGDSHWAITASVPASVTVTMRCQMCGSGPSRKDCVHTIRRPSALIARALAG